MYLTCVIWRCDRDVVRNRDDREPVRQGMREVEKKGEGERQDAREKEREKI